MGMGTPGIQWDSYGNGNKFSRGMGWEWDGMRWEYSEWELRRESGKTLATVLVLALMHNLGSLNVCNVLIL